MVGVLVCEVLFWELVEEVIYVLFFVIDVCLVLKILIV